MKRVHVLVEGQTEESFVQAVLGPHLYTFDVHLTPILVATKRVKKGGKFKGGVTSYDRVKGDLRRLLADSSARLVTTMLDYYGLPTDFLELATLPEAGSCYERVRALEKAFWNDVNSSRFLPYFSLHEFEALLLTSPREVTKAFPQEEVEDQLTGMTAGVGSPEEINDGATTHPSARITRLLPTYRKRLHGPLITGRIGLPAIRERCPHFDGWLRQIEKLEPRSGQ